MKMLLQKIKNQKGFDPIDVMIVILIVFIIMIASITILAINTDSNQKLRRQITQEEKINKTPIPPKQTKVVKQKGEMNKL